MNLNNIEGLPILQRCSSTIANVLSIYYHVDLTRLSPILTLKHFSYNRIMFFFFLISQPRIRTIISDLHTLFTSSNSPLFMQTPKLCLCLPTLFSCSSSISSLYLCLSTHFSAFTSFSSLHMDNVTHSLSTH